MDKTTALEQALGLERETKQDWHLALGQDSEGKPVYLTTQTLCQGCRMCSKRRVEIKLELHNQTKAKGKGA